MVVSNILVGCGMCEMLKAGNGAIRRAHLDTAITSGDVDTIVFVSDRLGGELGRVQDRSVMNVRDFDVKLCAQLLEHSIIKPGDKYTLKSLRSQSVCRWFIEHNMVDVDQTLTDVASNAASLGGAYVDLLHYMIEQVRIHVPKDILEHMHLNSRTDLGVVDYLLAHGADIEVVNGMLDDVAKISPLLLVRYRIYKGLGANIAHAKGALSAMMEYERYEAFLPVMAALLNSMDVNARDDHVQRLYTTP